VSCYRIIRSTLVAREDVQLMLALWYEIIVVM